jgi:hypothetical protein
MKASHIDPLAPAKYKITAKAGIRAIGIATQLGI